MSMRVLFVVNSLDQIGGMEIVTLRKLNALAGMEGIELMCAYTDRGNFDAAKAGLDPAVSTVDLDVHTWEIHGSMSRMLRKYFPRMFKLRKKLCSIIREWRPDIVISVGSYEKYVIPTIRRNYGGHRHRRLREFHFVSDFRNLRSEKKAQARFLTWVDRQILTRLYDDNCLLTYEDLDRGFPDHPKRMQVVPNPLTTDYPDHNPAQADRRNEVVFVGRLEAQKNPEALLEAWRLTDREGWRLRLIGDGRKRRELEDAIKRMGLEDSVEITGWKKDVGPELRRAKIFAFTSVYEGFGLAIVEAMANGVVPVSFAAPCGPKDIITDGTDGFIVAQGDVQAMARRLQELMRSPDRLTEMSDAAYRRARDYSPERIAEQWMRLYRSLTEK